MQTGAPESERPGFEAGRSKGARQQQRAGILNATCKSMPSIACTAGVRCTCSCACTPLEVVASRSVCQFAPSGRQQSIKEQHSWKRVFAAIPGSLPSHFTQCTSGRQEAGGRLLFGLHLRVVEQHQRLERFYYPATSSVRRA